MSMSKKFDDGIILENFDVIVIFPIYGKFGAIRKRDSGRMVWKTYIFNNSNFLSHKNWQRTEKISVAVLSHCFE